MMNKLYEFNPIIKDIRNHFGFLFDKGYKIRSAHVPFLGIGDWEIVLESSECLIKLYTDRSTIFLVFAPVDSKIDNRLGIETIIYYITKKFVGRFYGDIYKKGDDDRKKQFSELADLLKEYLDQITPYFGIDEYQKHKDELFTAQKEYLNRWMKTYIPGF